MQDSRIKILSTDMYLRTYVRTNRINKTLDEIKICRRKKVRNLFLTMESGAGQKYRMVALDLDGTLLQPDHTVSNETVDYLRALHNKGLIIAIATGR